MSNSKLERKQAKMSERALERKQAKMRDMEECHQKLKALFESSNSGVGSLVLTSSHGHPFLQGKIIKIEPKKIKGKVVYILHMNKCEDKQIGYRVIDPVFHQVSLQLVECVPVQRVIVKNLVEFRVVSEFSTHTTVCD